MFSFQRSGPGASSAAAVFHGRLLALDPSLGALFQGVLADQMRRLLQLLGSAANGIEPLARLASEARQLGFNHASHHLTQKHFDTMGEALLWTLANRLGTDFTHDILNAWGNAYWILAETMKTGARDALAKLNRAAF